MKFYIGRYIKNKNLVTDGNRLPSLHVANYCPFPSNHQRWSECSLEQILTICEEHKIHRIFFFYCFLDEGKVRTEKIKEYFVKDFILYRILRKHHEK